MDEKLECPWCGEQQMKRLPENEEMVQCLVCGHHTDWYEAFKQAELALRGVCDEVHP